MSEPWFDAVRYAWIPGTVLGCLAGLWGAVGGMSAPRGKARGFVLGFGGFLLAASAVFLAAAIMSLLAGQPYGVWYALLLPGVIGLIVVGGNLPVAFRAYRNAEMRRMQAQDMES